MKAANWLTHLEYDWQSPVWRHWLEDVGRGHRLVRYDERGCGLSDRSPARLTLQAFVDDLAAVVDAADVERFALLGLSQGGAVAIAYAARYPERVTKLILCGAYARGRGRRGPSAAQTEEDELLQATIRVGWGRADPVFRRVFTMRFIPEATAEQMDWFDELERRSASPEMAARLRSAWAEIDVTPLLDQVMAPTLVAHSRGDAVVPFEEGRLLATRIANARFLPLEGRNHILLAGEPAWTVLLAQLRGFLGTSTAAPDRTVDALSARELGVLHLVAAGLSNEQIADRLILSLRTVERHLSNVYAKWGLSGKSARAAAAARLADYPQAGSGPGS